MMGRLRRLALASVVCLTLGTTLEGDGANMQVVEVHAQEELTQWLMIPEAKLWLPDIGLADYQRLEKEFPGRVSGALRYPVLERQIDLIKSIHPAVRVVLIPFTKDEEISLYERAEIMLEKAGLQVIRVDIEQDVSALRQVARRIAEAQALLMLPISIFESHQMRYWVALTARYNAPMIGAWREDQVVAGAAAGWVSTDAARESCKTTFRAYLDRHGRWPEHPCRPGVTYMENPRVLQHIGITIGVQER